VASYEEVRRESFTKAGSVVLTGVELDLPDAARIAGRERMFPISLCLCVQDNPQNPCPCRGPLVWISDDRVAAREETGRKSAGGEDIMRFYVERSAPVLVESVTAMTVESLRARLQGRAMLRARLLRRAMHRSSPERTTTTRGDAPSAIFFNPGWITAGIAAWYAIRDMGTRSPQDLMDDIEDIVEGEDLFDDLPM
jgi:hypothetical protein